MRHVVMFSGGAGSWAAAKRVAERHGTKDMVLLFSNTLVEDPDLYRFLIETAAAIHNTTDAPKVDVTDLLDHCRTLPEWGTPEFRAAVIEIGTEAAQRLPFLKWVMDGRDIFQVFKDTRFMGSDRVAKCSHLLKQKQSREEVEATCDPADTILYVGIDWTEIHRLEGVKKGWAPWHVEAPMCEEPYIDRDDVFAWLKQESIELPWLYKLGLAHNNCGGGCVKAGMAHWRHLLKVFPERYAQWEAKEEEVRQHIGKDVAMLRDRSSAAKCKTCHGSGGRNVEQRIPEPVYVEPLPEGGTVATYTPKPLAAQTVWEVCPDCEGSGRATRPLTLRQLREQTLIQPGLFDSDDWGGCGCFTAMEGVE